MLYVRRPGSDHEETHHFSEDDPFFSEVSVLVDNIEDIEEDPETAQILSSFEGASCTSDPCRTAFLIQSGLDAVKTYELTWAIREAAERSCAERKSS